MDPHGTVVPGLLIVEIVHRHKFVAVVVVPDSAVVLRCREMSHVDRAIAALSQMVVPVPMIVDPVFFRKLAAAIHYQLLECVVVLLNPFLRLVDLKSVAGCLMVAAALYHAGYAPVTRFAGLSPRTCATCVPRITPLPFVRAISLFRASVQTPHITCRIAPSPRPQANLPRSVNTAVHIDL